MADEQHSLAAYVSDMLALERHVRVPFETQANDADFRSYGNAGIIVSGLSSTSQEHVNRLERLLEEVGGHPASPLKSAVTSFEGFWAGAIDKMRKTKVSKGLRDDYTALALCCAGYTMLHTTALALEASQVAELAQAHLTEYAGCIVEIGDALPQVVLEELRETGLAVDPSVAEESRRTTEQAWRVTGSTTTTRGAEMGTIDPSRIETP